MKISLRAARVNSGLTLDDVAHKIHKHKMTVARWERTGEGIDLANFDYLCRLYNTDINSVILPKDLALS